MFSECTLFVAAHIVCLRLESLGKMDVGFGKVMSGTTVGGKSQSYKPQADADMGDTVWYTRSAYGRAFRALERRLQAGPSRSTPVSGASPAA